MNLIQAKGKIVQIKKDLLENILIAIEFITLLKILPRITKFPGENF